MKEHDAPLHDIEYVPYFEDIHVEYEPGETRDVEMPDGSNIVLKKLAEDYDPTDREAALDTLHEARQERRLVTGLIYVDPASRSFTEELQHGGHAARAPAARSRASAARRARGDRRPAAHRQGDVSSAYSGVSTRTPAPRSAATAASRDSDFTSTTSVS